MEHNIRHTFRLSDDDKLLVTAHTDRVSIHCGGVALTLSENHAEALAKALDLLNNPKHREDVIWEAAERLLRD